MSYAKKDEDAGSSFKLDRTSVFQDGGKPCFLVLDSPADS